MYTEGLPDLSLSYHSIIQQGGDVSCNARGPRQPLPWQNSSPLIAIIDFPLYLSPKDTA